MAIDLEKYPKWRQLGYFDSSPANPNTLTYAIHPVFDRVDANGKRRWTLKAKGYEEIKPVLRLASALLESPASIAFMHALLHSPRTKDHRTSQLAGFPCYEFQRSTLPIPEGEHPGPALVRLAKHVHWNVIDSDEQWGGTDARNVPTYRPCVIADEISDESATGSRRHGFSSTIHIRQSIIVALIKSMRADSASVACLSQQVWVARLICHEVMHAFNTAVDSENVAAFQRAENMGLAGQRSAEWSGVPRGPGGRYSTEPFFDDQRIAEIGYCWENEVFGGELMHQGDTSAQFLGPLIVLKWPHHNVGKTLLTGATQGWVPRLTRAGAKKSQTYYYVPAAYILDVTRREYWEGAGTAKIPKVVGARRRAGSELRLDPDWFSDESSEGEWEADEEGNVYREEGRQRVRERKEEMEEVGKKEEEIGEEMKQE